MRSVSSGKLLQIQLSSPPAAVCCVGGLGRASGNVANHRVVFQTLLLVLVFLSLAGAGAVRTYVRSLEDANSCEVKHSHTEQYLTYSVPYSDAN